MRKVGLRLALLLVGLVVGIGVVEFLLQLFFPGHMHGAAGTMNFALGTLSSFQEDPECGYMPRPNSVEYDQYGCVRNREGQNNEYALPPYNVEDRKGRQRLLFSGDSVTHRGEIIRGVRKLAGDKDFEYWNAGVEGFNTHQERLLYERHNRAIKPDHVILTFHNNDFERTPIFTRDATGQLKMYTPNANPSNINPWLLRHSHLYRLLVGLSIKADDDRNARAAEVEMRLREFADVLAKDKVRFSVVVFPVLEPWDKWNELQRWQYEQQLAMCAKLKLTHYDLRKTSDRLMAQGKAVQQEPGDPWHPNREAGEEMARQLLDEGLLKPR
jgi:hypothetical protein